MAGNQQGGRKTAAKRHGMTLAEYEAKLAAGEKHCTKCKTWRPVELFGLDNTRGDGLATRCLICSRTPGGGPRNHLTDICRQARNAVNDAVRKGRLAPVTTLPCFDCGEPANEYDHHRGYERVAWLDVQACCYRCHRARDAARREARGCRLCGHGAHGTP